MEEFSTHLLYWKADGEAFRGSGQRNKFQSNGMSLDSMLRSLRVWLAQQTDMRQVISTLLFILSGLSFGDFCCIVIQMVKYNEFGMRMCTT